MPTAIVLDSSCAGLTRASIEKALHSRGMDCRDISAFTRVFDALCPAMTMDRSVPTAVGSGAVQEPRGIERGRSLADFEMQLRRVDVAGLAGARDHLPAFDLIAALDQELLGMGVSGHVAVGMAHQNEVAIALELVAGIGHDAVFGGLHP